MTPTTFRTEAAKVLALPSAGESIDHLLARLRHCGPEGERLRRAYLLPEPHACESITTADGHGAYCKHCGDTLA